MVRRKNGEHRSLCQIRIVSRARARKKDLQCRGECVILYTDRFRNFSRVIRGGLHERNAEPLRDAHGNRTKETRSPCGTHAATVRKERGTLAGRTRRPYERNTEPSRDARGDRTKGTRSPCGMHAATVRKGRGTLAGRTRNRHKNGQAAFACAGAGCRAGGHAGVAGRFCFLQKTFFTRARHAVSDLQTT